MDHDTQSRHNFPILRRLLCQLYDTQADYNIDFNPHKGSPAKPTTLQANVEDGQLRMTGDSCAELL